MAMRKDKPEKGNQVDPVTGQISPRGLVGPFERQRIDQEIEARKLAALNRQQSFNTFMQFAQADPQALGSMLHSMGGAEYLRKIGFDDAQINALNEQIMGGGGGQQAAAAPAQPTNPLAQLAQPFLSQGAGPVQPPAASAPTVPAAPSVRPFSRAEEGALGAQAAQTDALVAGTAATRATTEAASRSAVLQSQAVAPMIVAADDPTKPLTPDQVRRVTLALSTDGKLPKDVRFGSNGEATYNELVRQLAPHFNGDEKVARKYASQAAFAVGVQGPQAAVKQALAQADMWGSTGRYYDAYARYFDKGGKPGGKGGAGDGDGDLAIGRELRLLLEDAKNAQMAKAKVLGSPAGKEATLSLVSPDKRGGLTGLISGPDKRQIPVDVVTLNQLTYGDPSEASIAADLQALARASGLSGVDTTNFTLTFPSGIDPIAGAIPGGTFTGTALLQKLGEMRGLNQRIDSAHMQMYQLDPMKAMQLGVPSVLNRLIETGRIPVEARAFIPGMGPLGTNQPPPTPKDTNPEAAEMFRAFDALAKQNEADMQALQESLKSLNRLAEIVGAAPGNIFHGAESQQDNPEP